MPSRLPISGRAVRRRVHLAVHLVLALAVIVASVAPALAAPLSQRGKTRVSPPQLEVILAPGARVVENIGVETDATPIPKLDVLFLFDVTSSMRDVLEAARTSATQITGDVQATVKDVAFGVASVGDYANQRATTRYGEVYGKAGDYPWRVDQPIDVDADKTVNAIRQMTLINGGDGPEAYANALLQVLFLNWRPGAKHVVVFFADSVAHDPKFYGEDFGDDPGTGGLSFTEVVDKLREQRIQVITVNSFAKNDDKWTPLVAKGLQYVGQRTGGQTLVLKEAHQVSSLVTQGLIASSTEIKRMEVSIDTAYSAWLSDVTPAFHSAVGGGQSRNFKLTLVAPAGAKAGDHTFTVSVLGDGATLGTVRVTAHVSPPALVFNPKQLADAKRGLADKLSELKPDYPTTLTELVFRGEPPVTYAAEEKQVMGWMDDVMGRADTNNFSVGLAFSRILLQERSLDELYGAEMRSSAILGQHVGNVIAVGIEGFTFVKKLERALEGKHLVGGLVTKIAVQVTNKLADLMGLVMSAFVKAAPDSSLRDRLNFFLTQFRRGVDYYLQNNKGDRFNTLLKIVASDALEACAKWFARSYFVTATHTTVTDALRRAQGIAAASHDPVAASERHRTIEARSRSTLGTLSTELLALEDENRRVEEAQGYTKVAGDLADIGAAISVVTGVGAVVGAFLKYLGILTRLVDIALSGTMMYQSVIYMGKLPATAKELSDSLLADSPATTVLTADRGAARPGLVGEGEPRAPLADGSPLRNAALAALAAQSDTYKATLGELSTALERRDSGALQAALDRLASADEALAQQLTMARGPIYANAATATAPDFPEKYTTMVRAGAHFDIEDIAVYLTALRALDGFKAEDVQSAREQIAKTIDTLDASLNAIQAVLPLVSAATREAFVVGLAYTAPPDIRPGQSLPLTVRVANMSPVDALRVTVSLDLPENVSAQTPPQVVLDRIASGAQAEAQFSLRWISGERALMEAKVHPENGDGMPLPIVLLASHDASGAVPPTGPASPSIISGSAGGPQGPLSPLGLFLILGAVLAAAVGAGLVVALRRPSPHRTPMPPLGTLLIQTPGLSPRTVPVRHLPIDIGRLPGQAVVLNDPEVSRRHARIYLDRGALVVANLGSANGVYVNGQRIERQRLQPGDTVRVGQTTLTLQWPDDVTR